MRAELKRINKDKKASDIFCDTKLKQGKIRLYNPSNNTYCAIGVLIKEMFDITPSNGRTFWGDIPTAFPEDHWEILASLAGLGIYGETFCDIIRLNDVDEYSFKQICSWLRKKEL